MSNSEHEKLNQRLVQKLYKEQRFEDEKIGRAFLNTPRHLFLSGKPLELAYQDQAIPTKFEGNRPISSSSQPAMMAIMLQQLGLEQGMNILEIGAGTGFNAGLMSHLVGASGRITTIDIDQDIVENARVNLETAGITDVNVIHADGINGFAANAPYDRIILTVSAADIPPAWVDQLKENGRLLLPLSLNGPQKSIAFEKRDKCLHTLSVKNCGFMSLRGAMADQIEQILSLDDSEEGALSLSIRQSRQYDITRLKNRITQPATIEPISFTMTRLEGLNSFNLWLALYSSYGAALYASGEWFHNSQIPVLYHFSMDKKQHGLAPGLVKKAGVAFLAVKEPTLDKKLQIFVHASEDRAVQEELIDHVRAWHSAGRPQVNKLHITAYPRHLVSPPADDNVLVINNQFTQLLIQWPD